MILFVTGTGTDIGKTWVGSELARELRARGLLVRASKPLVSGWRDGDRGDAEELALATGQSPQAICPLSRRFAPAMAPVMAARAEGRECPGTAELAAQVRMELGLAAGAPLVEGAEAAGAPLVEGAEAAGVSLVEGAGGLRSPYTKDGDCLDFACQLRPDLVVIVSGAQLGCLHEVRSCAEDLSFRGLGALAVVLNRFDSGDELHLANAAWLREQEGLDVHTEVASLAGRIESVALGSEPS